MRKAYENKNCNLLHFPYLRDTYSMSEKSILAFCNVRLAL